jgi:hypothetical protein
MSLMNNEYPPPRFILTADALGQLANQGIEEKDFIQEVVAALTAACTMASVFLVVR